MKRRLRSMVYAGVFGAAMCVGFGCANGRASQALQEESVARVDSAAQAEPRPSRDEPEPSSTQRPAPAPAPAERRPAPPGEPAAAAMDDLDALAAAIAAEARIEPAAPAESARAANTPAAEVELETVFPGVRVDIDRGVVEFDGAVAVDVHDPDSPKVYLEVIVCAPDSKEHEALVVADVLASHVHAALLLAGFEPGSPARWLRGVDGLRPVRAEGEALSVEFVVDGRAFSPADWVRHELEPERSLPPAWLFAGSRLRDRDGDGAEEYDADGTGLIVGLHAFGSEVVAWAETAHPDSAVEEPVWLARNEAMPDRGEPVTVRLSRPD